MFWLTRSRTVLYFDSDDDDEGRSHIKESIVLESGSCSGSEEDPIDNVIVAVCPRDRKESFFDVVATDSTSSIAEKSQLIHEDTDLFEILNDATTGLKLSIFFVQLILFCEGLSIRTRINLIVYPKRSQLGL